MSELRKHMDCTRDNCLVGDPSPCILFTHRDQHPKQPPVVRPISRYAINDQLTKLAGECGVDPTDEDFDEVLNDLTHTVADAIDVQLAKQAGLT